jgi:hypothetical protein
MSALASRASHTTPEAEALSDGQIRCLSELILRPRRYVQRCVEQLGFLPDGGEKWTRTLQIRVPPSSLAGQRWWPVSLGTFRRRRYPDLTVTDCVGRRMMLLTRRQHGHVLARVILEPYLGALHAALSRTERAKVQITGRISEPRTRLIAALSDYLTLIPSDRPETDGHADRVGSAFRAYADALGLPERISSPVGFSLGVRLARENSNDDTQYLCWVRAHPGDVVTLIASYSALDPVREPRGSARRVSRTPGARPERGDLGSRHALGRLAVRAARVVVPRVMYLFRLFGMAAMIHRVQAPASVAANSYYFTVAPPPNTTVVALVSDSEGSHSDDGELDSPGKSFHTHNREGVDGRPAAMLRAHLMPERREHMTLAAGALLNILLVLLVAHGRFVNGFGSQTWILITPTVLTGVIAQQQRHYYARATQGQRAVLWLYLLFGALFLITVTFSNSHIPGSEAAWGWRAKATFIAFAMFSAFMAVVYTAVGPLYSIVTKRLVGWRAKRARVERHWVGADAPRRYARVVFGYCVTAFVLALVCSALVLVRGIWMWNHDDFKVSSKTTTARARGAASESDSSQPASSGGLSNPLTPPSLSP